MSFLEREKNGGCVDVAGKLGLGERMGMSDSAGWSNDFAGLESCGTPVPKEV